MSKTFRPQLVYECCFPWWVFLVFLLCLGVSPLSAEEPPPTIPLKNAVILIGANSSNDALSIFIQPGVHELDLYLQVDKSLKQPLPGKLTVTKLQAQSPPGDVVATKMRVAGASSKSVDDVPLQVSLTASDLLHITLVGGAFRPGTTYKGSLFLSAGGQINRWDMTLTTGGRGVMAVSQIGTIKFSRFPLLRTITGDFPITLYDKSEGGPYHHVRVRFEPAANPVSKAILSNFNINSFSFWEAQAGASKKIDLEQHGDNPTGINLGYRGQRTFIARINPLNPGEYTGALRFIADESSDDATDAKLPLIIQVRHHWLLPVLVILFGSLVGWYSSKYVISVRKARELARQVRDLRARAEELARPDPPRDGWEYPGEVTSYGLARVRVQLSQLALFASSALPVLTHEGELQQQRRDAELRVSALERLHSTRLGVQKVADGRPAAQWAFDQLLGGANEHIEGPAFDQTQQASFANLLKTAEAWLDEKTFDAHYREALVNRLTSPEIPSLKLVQSLPKGDIQQQLETLLQHFCPTKAEILDPSKNLTVLQEYDQTIAKVALLWRDRNNIWAPELAKACGQGECIEDLFRLVDLQLWEELKKAAEVENQLIIKPESTDPDRLETYDLVAVRLTSKISNVTDVRLLFHPLRVRWQIDPPDHNVRGTENHGLTMVQYFPLEGKVKIKAELYWKGRSIPLRYELELNIVPNREIEKYPLLSGGVTEWAVIAIAAGFAIATAMGTLYDSTFGSFNQYLTLFLWSAGAGTGGNIFKQLGTTSSPGGQAEGTLPKGGGVPAVK